MIRLLAIFLFAFAAFIHAGSAYDGENPNPAKWLAFSVDKLAAEMAASGEEAHIFLQQETIHAGLYVPADYIEIDEEEYRYDTLYVVTEGRLTIAGGPTITFIEPGDVAYVRAGVEHALNPFPEATYLRISPTSASSPNDPAFRAFWADDIRQTWKPDENEWNPFLEVNAMTFGLYMLPLALDGDQTLTHEVDEINVVIKGKARFRMDDDEIEVGPGSVMWVKAGVGHYFHDLSEDFEVLIMFRKDTQ